MGASMKAKWTAAALTIVAIKIAALSLIATFALYSYPAIGMIRQDAQSAKCLFAIATVSSSLAVLLLAQRNFMRVLINTPILLASTTLGIALMLGPADAMHESVARVWYLVFVGGACGAFFGHVLLAIGWLFARWLKQRRPDVRDPPTEMSIPAWRWESEGGRQV